MGQSTMMSASDIREAWASGHKMRERDFARTFKITEAELIAAHCGLSEAQGDLSAWRIRIDLKMLLEGAKAIGEVMVLTRNESAVHEKIGHYEDIHIGPGHALTLGKTIDLRIFPRKWVHGFAVEKHGEDSVCRSFQFFDEFGTAVHKIHLRPASDVDAFFALRDKLLDDNQDAGLTVSEPVAPAEQTPKDEAVAEELSTRWERMTDVHQFMGILRSLDLSRHEAVGMIGSDFARRVEPQGVTTMLQTVLDGAIPIMCFVGSGGCIQIHSGHVFTTKTMGPWLNIMDPSFHLHLRTDHIEEVWVVRKPTKDEHVTSLEAYDADKKLIIQFFGQRHEGTGERNDWRDCLAALPSFSSDSNTIEREHANA